MAVTALGVSRAVVLKQCLFESVVVGCQHTTVEVSGFPEKRAYATNEHLS